MTIISDPYTVGEGATALLWSVAGHLSVAHLSKNVLALLVALAVLQYFGGPRDAIALLSFAPLANYWFAAVAGSVVGASGGTFALLGAGCWVALEERPALTGTAMGVLLAHQIYLANPPVAILHGVMWVVGLTYCMVRTNTLRFGQVRN